MNSPNAPMRRIAAAAVTMATLGLTLASACVDETINPKSQETSTGGEGGAGGADGEGGMESETRGNPADFPATCAASCDAACSRLAECGADDSGRFPIDQQTCLDLCDLAEGGPFWGDISANFKCCAAQSECSAVQQCGGWLDHPDTQASCSKLCACFNSSSLQALGARHVAPAPFRFADHMVVVRLPSQHAAMTTVPHTTMVQTGRYARATFHQGSGPQTIAALTSQGELLPTFVDGDGRISAASGRVFVRASTTTALGRTRAITSSHRGTKATKLGHSRDLYTSVHADPWDAVDAVEALRRAGLNAELDMVRELKASYVPNDPLFPDQWHLRNVGQGSSTSGVDARVSEAWDLTLGDPQVLIAINDDGVDLAHGDFAGRLEPALNYPNDWPTLLEMGLFGGHGTPVAGVAASTADNVMQGAGVCPSCRVIPHLLGPIDLSGSFMVTEMQTADGFVRQVDAGAWVINNSWGISNGNAIHADEDQQSPPVAMVIEDAFAYAETSGRGGLGTVVVFAAGNENTEASSYASHPTTVGVTAIGDVGLKSYYSSHGPSLDVGAPSSGALTGITASAAGGGHTDSFGGTSSASPLVAGVAGLILSANPNLTAAEVRSILRASATPIDPVFGDYDEQGRSPYYGAGMVNAYVAVRMATGCTAAENCQAPSDDCGSQCGTGESCEPCRSPSDCAVGYACQALPSLGRMLCVAEKGDGACPAGTVERNDYCLPLAPTCNVCTDDEECNGRDDDCDGELDEDACTTSPRCWIDSLACPAGSACAAVSCVPMCTSDDDCDDGASCRTLKDQYGRVSGVRGCVSGGGGGCSTGCAVLSSSLPDPELLAFTECMMNGLANCNAAFGCSTLLPIEM